MSEHRNVRHGSTSCVFCRRMLRTEDGLRMHCKVKHRVEIGRGFQGKKPKEHPDWFGRGRMYCITRQRGKVIYYSIDEAWLWVLMIAVSSGYILTPYQCGPQCKEYATTHYKIVQRGEIAVHIRLIRMHSSNSKGCGRWHLANRVNLLAA